jgi:hypothetical protein
MDVEGEIDYSDVGTEIDEDPLEEMDETEDDDDDDDDVEWMEEDAYYTESDDENCTSRNFVR